MTARRKALPGLTDTDARFLVDAYYLMQDYRIRANAHQREHEAPHAFIEALAERSADIEDDIRFQLGHWVKTKPIGEWLISIKGIGPVITAGLLAHVNMGKRDDGSLVCPSPSALWAYAGLNPDARWEKGSKRPWNAALKRLCFLTGTCFEKLGERGFYGRLYRERLAWEIEHNASGANAAYAENALTTKKYKTGTITRQALEAGRLSDAHVHQRARRWTVKLFLSHVWEVWYFLEYGERGPKPYVFEHLGHVHRIEPERAPWTASTRD